MHRITLFTFMLLVFTSALDAQKISEKLVPLFTMKINKGLAPDSFGLSPDKPIQNGAFMKIGQTDEMMLQMSKLYNSFLWPTGEKLDFSKRGQAMNPKGGILDAYTITNPGTGESIKLYVDPYREAEVYVPRGLIALNAASLTAQVLPILNWIEELNNAPDAFADSASKEKQVRVLIFLQISVGLNYFFDDEIVNQLKSINRDLGGYLFRSYMFNSFLALSKGKDDNRNQGLKAMKQAYKKLVKIHPEQKNEVLGKWLSDN